MWHIHWLKGSPYQQKCYSIQGLTKRADRFVQVYVGVCVRERVRIPLRLQSSRVVERVQMKDFVPLSNKKKETEWRALLQ